MRNNLTSRFLGIIIKVSNPKKREIGRGENVFELDLEMIAKLRERRARKNITLEKASQEIGISRRTLGQIENEKILSVRKTVYKKLVDWLVNEKIYKEG